MRTNTVFIGLTAALLASACVQHRPIRNGLRDESVYLDKAALTNVNPKLPDGSTDSGWLFDVTTIKTSSPNALGDYIFPGEYTYGTKYIRFRFQEESLQIVDGLRIVPDDPNNPNDDTTTTAERVMFEFGGQHVDVKLQESLDGERTNLLSENTEEPWQTRQKFKVDFEKTTSPAVDQLGWSYGEMISECVDQMSANLVPGSFVFDERDQYMGFTLEVSYAVKYSGYCWDLVSYTTDVGTATVQYHFSFFRPGVSNYVPEVIAEKDIVNKKYGAWQQLALFEDPMTGLFSAKSLLERWNPNRPSDDPVVYYFAKGFPPEFKSDWGLIKEDTNRVLEAAGATLRLDFRDYNDGGIERQYGDMRYSFVVWHQDPETTRGLLGMAQMRSDPRTGEILSATVNLYNIGMDWYRYMIQSFLEANGAPTQTDPDVPWEQTVCTPGEMATPVSASNRLQTTLFDEMRRTLDITTPNYEAPTDDFVPTPVMTSFRDNYHRVLPEIRYTYPGFNTYVWGGRSSSFTPDEFHERMAMERDFQRTMEDIESNMSPFASPDLTSPEGLAEQQTFREQMREWIQNHKLLQADMDMMLNRRTISVFNELDAVNAIKNGARVCKDTGFWESNTEYTDRIVKQVVNRSGIHEFGHTMALRHNFYGSVDAGTADHPHMRPGEVSSSVMDYVEPQQEAGAGIRWGLYDDAALTWIYGTAARRTDVMKEDYLFCTDEHSYTSPLCRTFDLGVTPSQIVLNEIEAYDWLYDIRNRRAFRTFWNTGNYAGGVYNAVFPMQRFWYLGLFDWGGGGVQDTLKRLDQVEGKPVKTPQEYNEISVDFYNDLQAANAMMIAFYDAVINEPASFRNYMTEYDPYYGDVLRMGIITDKLFTTYAFVDFMEVWDYDPNLYTYIAMFDVPFGSRNAALSEKVLDNFLGANYDTFPWFQYMALEYFAANTNSNLINNVNLKDRIAIKRFNTAEALAEQYPEARVEGLAPGNTAQIFTHDGQRFIYSYLDDRNWHLVANESRSPVSFQYMKDYNEALNAQAATDLDNYGLKILLAYYEYYNNFQGF